MHAPAERGQDAHPPVAYLVPEALDDDGTVGGKRPGRLLLLAQIREEVRGCTTVEEVIAGETRDGLLVVESNQLAARAADCLAELVRAARPLALPERHCPRDSGSR